ncbi:MAG: alpha-ribazole phosphatase, partial [Bacillota bacterium]|nr:alpha-ribazole phosphatase [Bacillota bacterium]
MDNLYLIRHGETEYNKKKVYYGATDCDLTELGREQARSIAKSFQNIHLDLAVVSPLIRAQKTADIILAGKSLQRETELRVREMNFGIWEGKYYKDLQGDPAYDAWMADWENVRPPQGESHNDLVARVSEFYNEFKQRPEKDVALICHNAVLMVLLTRILETDPSFSWHFAFDQGCYTHIRFADGYPIL